MQLTIMTLRPNFKGTFLVSKGLTHEQAMTRAAEELIKHIPDDPESWQDIFRPHLMGGAPTTTRFHNSDLELIFSVS